MVSGVEEKISSYIAKNPELKKFPQEKVISIMQSKNLLSKIEVENWFSSMEKKAQKAEKTDNTPLMLQPGRGQPFNAVNSTFGKGFINNVDVIPQWQTQQPKQVIPEAKKYTAGVEKDLRSYAANYLYDSVNSAIKLHNDYLNSYGLLSTDEIWKEMKDVANLFDLSDDGRGITTQKEMAQILNAEQKNALKIKNIEHKKGAFEYQFEKARKLQYNPQNIEEFITKSEEYTKATAYKEKYDKLTDGISEIKSIIRSEDEYKQAKKYTKGAAAASLTPPKISSHEKFGVVLLEFCNGDKELLNKYMSQISSKMGSKEEIEKNYPKILDELQEGCKKGYQKQLLGKSYEQYTKEYQNSFKKAFGNENVEELTKGYIENQKMGASYTKMGIVIASTILLGGSNIVAGGATKLAANLGPKVAGAIVKATMTAVPIVENVVIDTVGAVTSQNGLTKDRIGEILEEQKASLPYMVFGAYAAGPLGESVKTYLKSNPTVLPSVLKKVFSAVPKSSSGAGLTAEISADTFFHTVWEGTSLLEAFKVEGQTDAGMKAVNKIMTALIGGRANAATNSIMQKANLKDIKITEHTEPNGTKTYTTKGPDGKVHNIDAEGLLIGMTDKVAEAVKDVNKEKSLNNVIKAEIKQKNSDKSNQQPKTVKEEVNVRTVETHQEVSKISTDDIKEFNRNIQKIEDNNLRDLNITKNLSEEDRTFFLKELKRGGDLETLVWLETGNKPSVLLAGEAVKIARKLQSDKIDFVERYLKFPNGEGIDNAFLLDKKSVKEVITANKEIYQKRMNLDEKTSVDEIYSKLISKDSPLKDEAHYPDIIGLTLGFSKNNSLIFALERNGKVKPQLRYHNDLTDYKEALKAALNSDDSIYKNFSDDFKKDLGDTINGIDEIVSSLKLSQDEYTGFCYISYVNEPSFSKKFVNGFKDLNSKLSLMTEKPEQVNKSLKIEELNRTEQAPEILKENEVVQNSKDKIALNSEIKPLEIDKTKPLTFKSKDGKSVLTEYGEKVLRDTADNIREIALQNEPEIVILMKSMDLGEEKKNMVHRAKSAQSIYDKVRNAMCDEKNPMSYEAAVKSVRDAVGTRTTLEDFDYKKYPEIVEMYKKDPQKAYEMAAEKQSLEMKESVAAIILSQAAERGDISAIKLTNYKGKDGLAYFSDKQVAELRDYASQHGIDLSIKDNTSKIRPSGYTALQMNFKTKNGFTFEWQLRGKSVDKFAECEHVAYDAREGKDITGGNPVLKKLYEPAETSIKNMSKADFKEYNQYLTKHYDYLRKKELGFEVEKPELPEKFDNHLQADALEILHDLAVDLKNGKITEPKALNSYHKLTDEFADWSLREEPQLGSYVFPMAGIKVANDKLVDFLHSSSPKSNKSKIVANVQEMYLSEKEIDITLERFQKLGKKIEPSVNHAEIISKMSDESFDYVNKIVNAIDTKITPKGFSDLCAKANVLLVGNKNIKNIPDAELRNNLIKFEEKIASSIMQGSGNTKLIDIYENLVLKLDGFEDKVILAEVNNSISKLINLESTEALIDAVNLATGKYSIVDGKVHKTYKKMLDVNKPDDKSDAAASANSNDFKSDFTHKLISEESELGKDFKQSLKFEAMKDYLSVYGKDNIDLAKHIYEKYYSSTLSENVKAKCNQIGDEFGTRLFLVENDDISSANAVHRELSLWKEAGKGETVFPPTLDLSKINTEFVDSTFLGLAYSFDKHIELKGNENIDYTLRHEMMHINDKLEFARFGKFGPRKEYDFTENGTMLKEKKWFREEFEDGCIEEWHIDYAYTNRAEFVAVASEGDFTKYSPEFKKVLVELGLPEWVLTMPKNQIEDRIKNQYKGTDLEQKVNLLMQNTASVYSSSKADLYKVVESNPEKIDILNDILCIMNKDKDMVYNYPIPFLFKLDHNKLIEMTKFLKMKQDDKYLYQYYVEDLAELSTESLPYLYKLAQIKDNEGNYAFSPSKIKKFCSLKNINRIGEKNDVIKELIQINGGKARMYSPEKLDEILGADKTKIEQLMPIIRLKNKQGIPVYDRSLGSLLSIETEKLPILYKYAKLDASGRISSFHDYGQDLLNLSKFDNDKLESLYEFAEIEKTDGEHPYRKKFDVLGSLDIDKINILKEIAKLKDGDEDFWLEYNVDEFSKWDNDKLKEVLKYAGLKNKDGGFSYGPPFMQKMQDIPADKMNIVYNIAKLLEPDGSPVYYSSIVELPKLDNEKMIKMTKFAELKNDVGDFVYRFELIKLANRYSLEELDELYISAAAKNEDGSLRIQKSWDLNLKRQHHSLEDLEFFF